MATGMESMFLSILKSMGFNPQETIAQITEFADNLKSTLAQVDARFTSVETKLDRVLDRLDTISPQVPPAACGIDETLTAVTIPSNVTLIKDAA